MHALKAFRYLMFLLSIFLKIALLQRFILGIEWSPFDFNLKLCIGHSAPPLPQPLTIVSPSKLSVRSGARGLFLHTFRFLGVCSSAFLISNLKDRYTLGEQLGWGQFGVIRECYDKFTHELLACKSIAKDRLVTEEDVQSIRLEIEIVTRLSGHPNVADLKAVYEDEDYVHLVMELCAGGELFCQLEKQGKFTESESNVLFRHLMQVVTNCHDNGVVHRDLKPENILLFGLCPLLLTKKVQPRLKHSHKRRCKVSVELEESSWSYGLVVPFMELFSVPSSCTHWPTFWVYTYSLLCKVLLGFVLYVHDSLI